jgi:hypothetical protein
MEIFGLNQKSGKFQVDNVKIARDLLRFLYFWPEDCRAIRRGYDCTGRYEIEKICRNGDD